MNKKVLNTNEKIYNAFSDVLAEKNYNDIRIQNVLDASGVARSTFYAHFKTKEDLLKSICTTIFGHVFSHTLDEENSHDFSKSSIFDYKHFITHLFYHLLDEHKLIHAILASQGKEIFLDYLREGITDFVKVCLDNHFVDIKGIPEQLKVTIIVEYFILILKYWDDTSFADTPETLTKYFMTINAN